MTFYPVIIPTLNRIKHLQACICSLQQCTHADKTELVIGLDYPPSEDFREGYEDIKAYLPSIKGFSKVTIFERDYNYGEVRNTRTMVDYCLSRYDAFIFTEDDNVFSPCFLDFMNKALDRYRDDERVTSVCGFCYPINCGTSLGSACLTYEDLAWGEGFWRDKWRATNDVIGRKTFFKEIITSKKKVEKYLTFYPRGFHILLDMIKQKASWGDIERTAYNFLTDHFQIQPNTSLVRNIGHDGSGLHSVIRPELLQQDICSATTYDLPNTIEMQRTDIEGKGLRHLYMEMPTDSEAYQAEIKQLRKRARNLRLLYQHPWLQWLVDRPKRLQWYAHRYWLAVLRRCGKPV